MSGRAAVGQALSDNGSRRRRFTNANASAALGLRLWTSSALFLLAAAGPAQFLAPSTVAYRLPGWRSAPVGVVVAYCGEDLSSLWRHVSCERHNVFVYVRCATAEAAWGSTPEGIRQCVSVHVLNDKLLHEDLGRAHHAYLTHVVENYDNLNSVTGFMKGSKGFSAQLFRAMGPETSFWQLGCKTPDCGRKGPFTFGANRRLRRRLDQTISQFGLNTSVAQGFTQFQSQFAASRARLHSLPRETYQHLKDFVLEPSPRQAACSHPGNCCNCFVLERLWAHLLGCGDEMSKMGAILQEYKPIKWNPILARSCYEGHGGPIMFLQETEELSMLSGLYLGALLRWTILLPSQEGLRPACTGGVEGCRDLGSEEEPAIDQEHFIRHAAGSLGVTVLRRAPQGYRPLTSFPFRCQETGTCTGAPERLMQMYSHITGPFLVPSPGLRPFTGLTRRHGMAISLANEGFKPSKRN